MRSSSRFGFLNSAWASSHSIFASMKRQSGIGENFLSPSLPSGSNSTIDWWSCSSCCMYSLIVCWALATSPFKSSEFAFIAMARPK